MSTPSINNVEAPTESQNNPLIVSSSVKHPDPAVNSKSRKIFKISKQKNEYPGLPDFNTPTSHPVRDHIPKSSSASSADFLSSVPKPLVKSNAFELLLPKIFGQADKITRHADQELYLDKFIEMQKKYEYSEALLKSIQASLKESEDSKKKIAAAFESSMKEIGVLSFRNDRLSEENEALAEENEALTEELAQIKDKITSLEHNTEHKNQETKHKEV